MKYKINIHAHSIFSDGINSPYVMALQAKALGFSALVITDHFYGKSVPEFMSRATMKHLKKAVAEAKKILPVIIGMEVPFMGQEVLVFGGAAITHIIYNDIPSMEEMLRLKIITGCAIILCHPGLAFEAARPALDGFERFNSGHDFFEDSRSMGCLVDLPKWCNSDAHRAIDMGKAYNLVDSKIETEGDLIKYIKRGRQPDFFVAPREEI